MRPSFSLQNHINSNGLNSEFLSQDNHSFFGVFNLSYHFLIQFGHAVFDTLIIWRMVAAFVNAIFNIGAMRSKEEMCRIDALRIVAFMKYTRACVHYSEMQFPRGNVSRNIGLLFGFYHAVIVSVFTLDTANPKPASLSFVDLFPESFFKRYVIFRHSLIAILTAIFPTRMIGRNENALAI